MLIYKTKNVLSNIQKDFIFSYVAKFPYHKIFIEYNVLDFINYQEKITSKKIDQITKKRCRNLRFDIFDVTRNVVIEIDGSQHNKFNEFFHKDVSSLDRQKNNDRLKKIVCDFFSVDIIRLKF